MAARQCPQCQQKVPAGWVAAYSDGFPCPRCNTLLEVSAATRYLAITAGVAGGAVAAWLTVPALSDNFPRWVMPLLASFLVFSAVSSLVTMLIGDLVVQKEPEPAPVAIEASHTHGSH
jgi:hypothetical protein